LLLQFSYPADILTSEDNFLDKNCRLNVFREVYGRNAVRQMEIESQGSIFTLIILDNTFQDTDMERNMLLVDR